MVESSGTAKEPRRSLARKEKRTESFGRSFGRSLGSGKPGYDVARWRSPRREIRYRVFDDTTIAVNGGSVRVSESSFIAAALSTLVATLFLELFGHVSFHSSNEHGYFRGYSAEPFKPVRGHVSAINAARAVNCAAGKNGSAGRAVSASWIASAIKQGRIKRSRGLK